MCTASLAPDAVGGAVSAPDPGAVALLSERVRLGGPQVDSRRAAPRSCVRPRTLMLALLLAELLSACGGGGGSGQSGSAMSGDSTMTPAPPAPPVPTQAPTGHYVGAVKIADVTYFGDAVFTQDGEVRLYVGGPYDNGGELQLTRPESSEQFVGTIEMRDTQWSGSGLIIGQQCAINAASRFCGQPAPAAISATVQLNTDGSGSAVLQGAIQVTTSSGTETWPLNLQLWGAGDPTLATSAAAAGQYEEVLAEFASAGDVVMNIDSSGKLFFQSANSACVGNGALVPHLDGAADTYDVTLTMENCDGAYAYLNGQYDGLALYTASSYWDYDSQLRMWLSKPTGKTPPAALTTLGEPL
jgi:hypothetical protein